METAEVLVVLAIFALGFVFGFIIADHLPKDCYGCGCGLGNMGYWGFEDALEQIQHNCNSTYITKRGSYGGWWVFNRICKEGGYCKHGYTPLDVCIAGTEGGGYGDTESRRVTG